MKYITEKYDSLITFEKSLNRERIGRMIDEGFNPDFVGVESEEKANNLLLYGDEKTVKKIECKELKRFKTTKNTLYRSPVGFTPCVGAVMAGHPNNMYNIHQTQYNSCKILNFFYAIDVAWNVSAADITAVSVKILNVIAALESKGYRVNLYITSVCYPVINKKTTYNTLLSLFVKIKDSGKKLNISKIAYPLTNPAMYRWHTFKWGDTVCKDLTNTVVLTKESNLHTVKDSIRKQFRCKFALESYYTMENKSEKEIIKEMINQ